MLLQFDVYSGNNNPTWQLPASISKKIIELTGDLGLLERQGQSAFPARLGYRGLRIVLPAEIATKYRISPWINLSADLFGHSTLVRELASITRHVGFLGIHELQKLLDRIVPLLQRASTPPPLKVAAGPQFGPCKFEMLPFEPRPWNDAAFKPKNNCYAYASNKRALYSEKPQPGIGSGKKYRFCTGPDVALASRRDGAHEVNDCFEESEAPRMLVALVIWPNEDYHWYRKHPDCWGHKPGSTDARNTDNSSKVIIDPQTCDRGPYTDFYGYMLIPKSQKVAA